MACNAQETKERKERKERVQPLYIQQCREAVGRATKPFVLDNGDRVWDAWCCGAFSGKERKEEWGL